MKINFRFLAAALLLFCLFPCAQAQVSVVKQDGKKLYLDTSELNRNVRVGERFKIIVSQEKLINPKTGKDLGYVYQYSPEGKIIEVQPLYAVGEMQKAAVYPAGSAVVIEALPAPAAAANAAPEAAAPTAPASSRKIKTWPALTGEIISAVKADISPLAGQEIAALDSKGVLTLYAEANGTLTPAASYTLPAGQKPLTLSALDLMQAGRAQLFAVIYNPQRQKISTLVLDGTGDEIKLLGTLPYFVKELGCGQEKILYAQKPFIGGAKGGDARPLEYKNGKFTAGKEAFSTRGHWLTGLSFDETASKTAKSLVYTASDGKLRLQLGKGRYAQSPALFGAAPNRVEYKQEIISFYPSLQAYGPAGHATLAAVENKAKHGLLSEQFGQYDGSKIHFLTYENGSLDVRESVALNGFLYDTNCTDRGILAPQVLSGGQSVLTEIYR